MRDLSRRRSCTALAGALLLVASVTLAEERKPAQTAPLPKAAPAGKRITVDQDLNQPDQCVRNCAKTPPPTPQGKR